MASTKVSKSPRGRSMVLAALAVAALVAAGVWFVLKRPAALEHARNAYARGDWAAAAAEARLRLREHPGDIDAERLLARASFHRGRDQIASEIYQRLGNDALEAEDCARLAAYLNRVGERQAALSVLEIGVARDPNHAEVLTELIRLYSASDQLSEALTLADRLRTRPGQAAAGGVLQGMLRHELEQPRDAAFAIEQALRADPELQGSGVTPVKARALLVRAYLEQGRPDDAARALGPLSDGTEKSWLASRVALQRGDVKAAAAALAASSSAAFSPLAREPARYVGSARCARCHGDIVKAQQGSHHASTLLTGERLRELTPPKAALPDPAEPSVAHLLRWVADQQAPVFETRAADVAARATVEYAFGSDDRGATPVGRDDKGQWRELRLSHYGGNTWDLTTGHPRQPPEAASGGAHAYLGRALTDDAVRRCVDCHSTSLLSVRDRQNPAHNDRGIGCERCHGPGGHHVKAVDARPQLEDLAIVRPGQADGPQVTSICARCHSPRGMDVRPDDPTSIRFQGTTLTWGRCYTESRGALSCVTCHDPHRDAESSASYYEVKCLACHQPGHTGDGTASKNDGARPIDLSDDVRRVPCPVNPKDGCVGCHMPTRSGVIPHTSFTDHWIRVYPADKRH